MSQLPHFVPSQYQFQTTECGVPTLAMVLAHYGKHVSLDEIRTATGVSRDCMNAADMVTGAKCFGLDCKVKKCEPEDLSALGFPVIVYLNFIHFNLLEEIGKTHVRLYDPHSGPIEISHAQFDEQFTGIALTFSPNKEFTPDRHAIDRFWPLHQLRRREGALIASAGVATIAAAFALSNVAQHIVTGDLTGALIASLLFGLAVLASHECMAILQSQLSRGLSLKIMRHLAKMAPSFFMYFIPDRIMETVHAPIPAARQFCEDILPHFIGLLGAPVLLTTLWLLNPVSAYAVGGLLLVTVFTLSLLWGPRSQRYHPTPDLKDDTFSALISDTDAIETWKTGGRVHNLIIKTLDMHAVNQTKAAVRRVFELGGETGKNCVLPFTLSAAIMSLIPGTQQGQISDSTALAVLLLAVALAMPFRNLADLWGQGRGLRKQLSHMQDLLTIPVPKRSRGAITKSVIKSHPNVALSLHDASFGHSKRRKLLVEELNVSVNRHEQLGITGPSGGGKSTIARLIAGVDEISSGQVCFGVQEGSSLKRSLLVKNPLIFEASVRENLRLWQSDISDADLWKALQIVCLDDVIQSREGGLDEQVSRNGSNLSGGQLQRLEIARALLSGAKFLVLDEALDSLNPDLEAKIRRNLRNIGCTLVIISHRLSTLAACERVLYVDKGRIGAKPNKAVAQQLPPSEIAKMFGATNLYADGGLNPDWPSLSGIDAPLRELALYSSQSQIRDLGRADTEPCIDHKKSNVGEIAATYGFEARTIRMTNPKWWDMDGNWILVFSHSKNRIMAIVPKPDGKCLFDPKTKSYSPLPTNPGAEFDEVAYRLYPQQPQESGALKTSLLNCIPFLRHDICFLSVALSALGVSMVGWPLIVKGHEQGSIYLIGAIVSFLLSLVCIELAGVVHWRRVVDLVEHSALQGLVTRVSRIEVPYIRHIKREEMAAAINAFPQIFRALRQSPPRQMAGAISSVALILYLALATTFKTALITVVFVICCLALAFVLAQLRRPVLVRSKAAMTQSRRFLFTAFTGMQRLRALGAEDQVTDQWRALFKKSVLPLQQITRVHGLSDAFLLMLPWLAVPCVFLTSGSPIKTADGLAIWLAVYTASDVSRALSRWLDRRLSLNHLTTLTNAPMEPVNDQLTGGPSPILAQNLCANHTGQQVLRGVSLDIKAGEILALTGASGSGKSTLVDVLMGFHRVDSGRVLFDGINVQALDTDHWRARTAVIQQADRLEQAMTVRGQIAQNDPIDIETLWKILDDVQLAGEVAAMPMATQTIVDDFRLSTGQRQRMLLARALIKSPELLILDEALSAVPEDIQKKLIATFRARGLTAVIVTHDESLIRQADRVAILDQGQMTYHGPVDTALQREVFQNIFISEQRNE